MILIWKTNTTTGQLLDSPSGQDIAVHFLPRIFSHIATLGKRISLVKNLACDISIFSCWKVEWPQIL